MANKTAVAVLPFKLLTPNPEDDYLGVALAEPLINRLSASPDLLVRPINAVMAYATRTTDFLLAAHELNVHLLVDGNVQRFGHRLRVHVQAWNISDGSSRLSEKFDAEVTELLSSRSHNDSLAKSWSQTCRKRLANADPLVTSLSCSFARWNE